MQSWYFLCCTLVAITTCDIIPGRLDKTYTNHTLAGAEHIYFFNLTGQVNASTTVRISISSENATDASPLFFVVRQLKGVNSWRVPFTTATGKSYKHVSRTLCPDLNRTPLKTTVPMFYLDISTLHPDGLGFIFRVFKDPDYIIRSGEKPQKMLGNPAEPFVYSYRFGDNEERVLVKATSESTTCAMILVQNSQCPVIGASLMDSSGVYATMTKQAGITVERSRVSGDRFYVVVIVTDTDQSCIVQNGKINPFARVDVKNIIDTNHTNSSSTENRIKELALSVEVLPRIDEYLIPLVAPLIFFGSFYIISFLAFIVFWCISEDGGKSFVQYLFPKKVSELEEQDGENPSPLEDQPLQTPTGSSFLKRSYDAINNRQYEDPVNSEDVHDDYDWLTDIDDNKDVYRLKTNLTVDDLSRKSNKKLEKKFNVYIWNLLTVAVFYALPVVQLVLTFQRVVNASGDQDICYYNFLCARPYLLFSAFNNVYSNIGYILLGLLFVFFVMRRDRLAKQAYVKDKENSEKYGIPKHYGIMYAMGYALCMEGVLSACYHVCPNYSNFQFDTAFMYMIGILGCLRLYQQRHQDVFLDGHFAYAGFAAVIFTSVIGVIFRSLTFWIIFCICHIVSCLFVSFHIYYMGRIRTALRMNWVRPGRWCTKPIYMVRFVLLCIFNVVNMALSINGVVNIPKDFATYLLGIIICNGLLYVIFYTIMKFLNKEKIKLTAFWCILLSLVFWGISIYFFVQGLTDWQLSPAESREGNKQCALLSFYDDHDLWHFLSATAMFFTFMGMLMIDDDLNSKKRTEIPVF